MGWFTPKISPWQMQQIQTAMKQLQDTVNLVNTTIQPDVFFKRLNFALDLLLFLQTFEKYKIFTHSTPTSDYKRMVSNMESTVDAFIDRSVGASQQKTSTFKSESAKKRNREKFLTSLIAAFDTANTFWLGNNVYPHYTGPLYTQNNYKRVQALYDDFVVND